MRREEIGLWAFDCMVTLFKSELKSTTYLLLAFLGCFHKSIPMDQKAEDVRLKRLRYRASYRGSKELDMVFRAFLDQHLTTLCHAELDQLEALMECPETDLAAWIFGLRPVPVVWDCPLMYRLRDSVIHDKKE